MMTLKQYLGLIGFLFVAAWAGFDFGVALLCLLGAGLFAAVAAVIQGDLDLADLQDRLQQGPGGSQRGVAPRRVR
jgi:hypothetical protein